MDTILLDQWDSIKQIYNTYMKQDFPSNELKPLAMMQKARRQGRYDCYGMFDGDELVGYAYFVKIPVEGRNSGRAGNTESAGNTVHAADNVNAEHANHTEKRYYYLLDYLAIVQKYRDQGYGSVLLRQLAERISDTDCMIVEVESPEKAHDEQERQLRERRMEFYLRNGYRMTGISAHVFGVEYSLLEAQFCLRNPKPGSIDSRDAVVLDAGNREHTEDEIREIYSLLYKTMIPAAMYAAFVKIR